MKLYIESLGAYDDEDVPYVNDPKSYTTNIAIEADDSGEENLPDTSIIMPKKIDHKKKVLLEKPPKDDGELNDLEEGESLPEVIRRRRPIPDLLGSISAYLLKRKASKMGGKIILNTSAGQQQVEALKAIIKSKIQADPKNGLHDFIKSFMEKLSENQKFKLLSALQKLQEKDDLEDGEDVKNKAADRYSEIPELSIPEAGNAEPSSGAAAVNPEESPTDAAPAPTNTDVPEQPTYAAGTHTAGELGRIYEMKRIYSRLLTIDEYLSSLTDPEMVVLQKKLNAAIKFFELIVSNIDTFLDKIDQIIIMYYDFLSAIYKILRAQVGDRE